MKCLLYECLRNIKICYCFLIIYCNYCLYVWNNDVNLMVIIFVIKSFLLIFKFGGYVNLLIFFICIICLIFLIKYEKY